MVSALIGSCIMILGAAMFLLPVVNSFPATLTLDRAIPIGHTPNLTTHGRMLCLLLPSQSSHYSLEMEAISVNGKLLPIDPSTAFSSPHNQGGTTLAYLPTEPFYKLVTAVSLSVLSSTTDLYIIIDRDENLFCYTTPESINGIFPQITLMFKGGANLILGPQDYLLNQGFVNGSQTWCFGFQKIDVIESPTVLGDIIMKIKFLIYDLVGKRIGWTDYNCRSALNVSTGLYIPPTSKRSSASTNFVPITSFTLLLLLLILLLVV